MGHNNWVDSIIVNSVKVNGHNNRFQSLIVSDLEDHGICN